jgi:ubiquinone/menaquinone biosynthesis C-methylase UbiE
MDESSDLGGGTPTIPEPNAVYALGRNPAESARLQRQAGELATESAALLDRVVLQPGQRAIDLGCGPRGIVDLLAARVAPGGRVVGLDADPHHAAMAAEFVVEQRLDGVEIVTADARDTTLPSASFDVVHARTLLINVPDPEQVVAEMVRLARPGGWVASMEPDTEYVLCYPPLLAFDRLCAIFPQVAARHGADPLIGRRVAELLREAGLEDVGTELRAQAYPPGSTRRTIRLDLVRSMRSQILELGIATEADLDEWDASARAHVEKPETVVVSGLMFMSWGRVPL